MASSGDEKTFNVSVVGLSGTEQGKGQHGVGKSCLCSRFRYQSADRYTEEHISVLSQSDFAGQIVNNDHFLYWGEVSKVFDGRSYTFHIIEQTEFIDDVSFMPFKTGHFEPYVKRCSSVKVHSAEKLMYICKDQLGMETDSSYEQKVMPDGHLNIDGFLCCYDVSQVTQRPRSKQYDFVLAILSSLYKARKPFILVSTKHDEADEAVRTELDSLLSRREFKGGLTLVETSARENVNVEAAFRCLAYLLDRGRPRFKCPFYADAARQRNEACQDTREAFQKLLRTKIIDPRIPWFSGSGRLQSEQPFIQFVDVFGVDRARSEYRHHVRRLREEQVRIREFHYLKQLPRLLKYYLPSVETVSGRSWPTVRLFLQKRDDFCCHFVDVCEQGKCWKDMEDFLDTSQETRIPSDLLCSSEAESCFKSHLQHLFAIEKKKEYKLQFKAVLEDSDQVMLGCPLSEICFSLSNLDCYKCLDSAERVAVYNAHQQQLLSRARTEFHELLLEQSHLFFRLSATLCLTNDDLLAVDSALQHDSRYRVFLRAEEVRKVMILNHLGFLQCPSRDRCFHGDACVDKQLVALLDTVPQEPMVDVSRLAVNGDVDVRSLNLVLLGKGELVSNLRRDICTFCTDNEYTYNGAAYKLDYWLVDSREGSDGGGQTLVPSSFKPDGCLCIYDDERSLLLVSRRLEQWLTWQGCQRPGDGLLFIMIQTCKGCTSHKAYRLLCEQGKLFADRFNAQFVDTLLDDEWKDVTLEEVNDGGEGGEILPRCSIEAALQGAISRQLQPSWLYTLHSHPDLRICMCLMCGDPLSLEVPLTPFLASEGLMVANGDPSTLTYQALLAGRPYLVEVILSSYHGRLFSQQSVMHGYILVYSAQRLASLAMLSQSTDSEPVYDQPSLSHWRRADAENKPMAAPSEACPLTPYNFTVVIDDMLERNVLQGACPFLRPTTSFKTCAALPLIDHCRKAGRHHWLHAPASLSPTTQKSSHTLHATNVMEKPIEITDYSFVKDALPVSVALCDYASVEDALPPGQLVRIRSKKHPSKLDHGGHVGGSAGGEEAGKDVHCNLNSVSSSFDGLPSCGQLCQESTSIDCNFHQTFAGHDVQFQSLPGHDTNRDLDGSGHWRSRIPGFKTLQDPERQSRKNEQRRLKQEVKQQRRSQKHTKMRVNDKRDVGSQSHDSCRLEDHRCSDVCPGVPVFVEKCVSYIEHSGMMVEGIYRIPGNRAEGDLLFSKILEDPSIDMSSLAISVNSVATMLKTFFNDLAEPLVPRYLHAELMEAEAMPEKSSRLLMLRGILKKLPAHNFELLKYLISHLCRVASHQTVNNMDERNLSRCWWPTIIRMEFSSYETMLRVSSYPEDIILTLLLQRDFFFHGGDEV